MVKYYSRAGEMAFLVSPTMPSFHVPLVLSSHVLTSASAIPLLSVLRKEKVPSTLEDSFPGVDANEITTYSLWGGLGRCR